MVPNVLASGSLLREVFALRESRQAEVSELPTLGNHPASLLCVACRYCERRGRYRIEALIDRHGARTTLADFLWLIAAD